VVELDFLDGRARLRDRAGDGASIYSIVHFKAGE
jgi:hypothetical protein